MVKRKPDLESMTPEEAAVWASGKTISEVVSAMGMTPVGRLAVVSFVPKNGNFNRCSVCRTLVTEENVIGHPMEVTVLAGDVLRCSVIVCSDRCEGRLRDRYR